MSTVPPPDADLFQHYAAPGSAYDEFVDGNQQTRSHLQPFVDAIKRLPKHEFSRRWEQALRTVHENGFAYGGYGTPEDQPRPWKIDPLPMLISAKEWQTVSVALAQRARLLNLVLRDLYGPQTLLKSGLLPPELVYSHPGFLRSYLDHTPDDDCWLQLYSADLGRSVDGNWWVLADRTEAPSGLGYALENRIVISRMLPEVFQQCQVQRLAPFFLTVKDRLQSLAPHQRENPHVVLLSHGPTSPNYFEDSYLARYLGLTLAEGGDLAVRNRHVMLKTLGGLLPVDVVLRRQNSQDCDPLELSATSSLGIAGLTQTARDGNVGIANRLGSGLVESAAFMPFMPKMCEAMLGEQLLMSGVASWWCGQPEGLAYVLKNLEYLIVQPAFRSRGNDGPTRESLQEMPLTKLAELIRRNPVRYAAQERVQRSTVPVGSQALQPAFVALRAYAVADNDSYTLMPGALARTSATNDPLELSIRNGEGSKDVWVLAESPVDHVSMLEEPGHEITLRRGGAELPSRAADNFFWLGRQLERAESSARLLRSAASRMSGETRSTSNLEIPVLLRCLADGGHIEPGYAVARMRGQLPPIERALPAMVFDRSYPGCLRKNVDSLFGLGSTVRDRISQDTWRIIHRIDESFRPSRTRETNLSELSAILDELITELSAFSGIVMESMTRTQAYRFLDFGRRMERALHVISLVSNCLIPLPEPIGPVLETMLEVADSIMTYRSRYLANMQLSAVLDLLLTDESNPRSLAFQFVQLADHVDQLPQPHIVSGYSTEQKMINSLLHSIRMLDIQQVAENHSLGDLKLLERLTEDWSARLPELSQAISHRYLVHAAPSIQLGDLRPQ